MVTHMSSAFISAGVLKLTRSASGVGQCQVGDRVGVGLDSLPNHVRAWLMRVSQMFEQDRINASAAAGVRTSITIIAIGYALGSRNLISGYLGFLEPYLAR